MRQYILRRDPLCKIKTICGGMAESAEVNHVIRAEVWLSPALQASGLPDRFQVRLWGSQGPLAARLAILRCHRL
jgi:hypothetical protein